MNDRQRTQQQKQQSDEQKALERERLGGPADYDEAGGTGLQGDSAETPEEASTGPGNSASGRDDERIGPDREQG